jgi:flagellar assembly protein FliH
MATFTTFTDTLRPFVLAGGQTTTEAAPAIVSDTAIIMQARMNSDATLADARLQALQIVQDAEIQAEALKEAAWQEGFLSGERSCRQQMESEKALEVEEYRRQMSEQLQQIVDDIGAKRQDLWNSQEEEIIGFVLDIARKVIKTEITQNKDVVMEVIKNALRRVADKENVRIRVSVADSTHVKSLREDIMSLADGLRNLEIIDDRRIADGGCVIETNGSTIDAKVSTQLDEIERVLSVEEND